MDRQQAVSRLLSLAPFVWVGLISYSLYLWHWSVLIAVRMLENSMQLPTAVASICLAISLVLAVVSIAGLICNPSTCPTCSTPRRCTATMIT